MPPKLVHTKLVCNGLLRHTFRQKVKKKIRTGFRKISVWNWILESIFLWMCKLSGGWIVSKSLDSILWSVADSTSGAGRSLWRWKLLENLLENCLNPDDQGRPYSWQHISFLEARPQLDKIWGQIRNIDGIELVNKEGVLFFCTCRGWPTGPIQGSLMLQICQVGISPIL